MDISTILWNVVLPSMVTAILLALAWRPWDRSAKVTRWQMPLVALALSAAWIFPAGSLYHWIWQPTVAGGDTARWFLNYGVAVTFLSIVLSVIAPKPSLDGTTQRGAIWFSALQFVLVAALGSLIAWLLMRGILARVVDPDDYDEIKKQTAKQIAIHISIVAVPFIAAAWSLAADTLASRGRSVLVPAVLAVSAFSSFIVMLMSGSNLLALMMAALAGMMIATAVLTLISKPSMLARGSTAAFFLIWSAILVYARHNQTMLHPDYFWLLMTGPVGLLVAFANWQFKPWLRLTLAIASSLIPPAIVLWQLYPVWKENMAGMSG